MRVLMVTSEAVPFAKTGGLADVCGALPRVLADRGHDLRLVLPRYRRVEREGLEPGPYPLGVPTGIGERWCQVLSTTLPDSEVPVSFIEHDALFDRPGLYGPSSTMGYPDNCLRFTVLCRGALQLCHHLGWYPDVVHCHDWQASLLPWFLEVFEANTAMGAAPSLLTIHNLAYQGRFSADELMVTGLGWEHFDWRGLEFQGGLNLLKGGIARATLLNTVSPTYAEEIQTPSSGEGLDGLLRYRSRDLSGVLNGIDDRLWDPATDGHLPARYDADDLSGKAACKAELQRRAGLPVRADRLVAGFIGRLTVQKGADLVMAAAEQMAALGVQLVILGTGDANQEAALQGLSGRLDELGVWIDFDEARSHLIYAGADLLLMPSRYEPCGLNQLYALRYGTLPVVADVGGLHDSVIDAAERDGTGFTFSGATAEALLGAVGRAAALAEQAPGQLAAMIRRAMEQDNGWSRAAEDYEALYEVARSRREG